MIFTNTEYFKEQANSFKKYGYYNEDPIGSPAWTSFWKRELDRCINGYSVGDVRITGDHYFYLNYCQIKVRNKDEDEKIIKSRSSSKTVIFPDFWDGDYEFFWVKEIAERGISLEDYNKLGLTISIKPEHLKGGKNLIIAKSRRKGFSFKDSAIGVNIYNTQRNALVIFGAFEKKYLYPAGLMTMASDYMDFLNLKTGWAKKRDFVNKQDHKRASYKSTTSSGNVIEMGTKSEIIAVTFADNPDAARGKDAKLILLDEAGVFPNLKSTYAAIEPSVSSGIYQTGMIIVYGTGANMGKGTTDFEDMFYNCEAYNFLAVENKWDEEANNSFCGFYFPNKKNLDGFTDINGNSNEIGAEIYENNIREIIKKTAKDRRRLDKRIIENSNCPKESFLRIVGNIFPTLELGKVLGTLEASNDYKNYWIGDLLTDMDGKIEWKPNKNLSPIMNYPLKKDENAQGCIIIYEPPYEDKITRYVSNEIYIASVDPYDHDHSQTGSLGSTLIYNRLTKKIAAEYSGRPETANEYYENVRKLLLYYNARALYENEKKGLFQYFEFKNCLYLLADEPEIIKDIIKDSIVSRKKGMHMTKELKIFGEGLIKSWLIEPYDERNIEIMNLHKIRCIPLLKELIVYDGIKNTDRVSSLIMLMYYIMQLRRHVIQTEKSKDLLDSDFFNKPIYGKPKTSYNQHYSQLNSQINLQHLQPLNN